MPIAGLRVRVASCARGRGADSTHPDIQPPSSERFYGHPRASFSASADQDRRIARQRRNVDDKTVALLRGQLYNSTKKEPTATLKRGDESPRGQNDPTGRTAERLAAENRVSPATVKRAGKYAQAAEDIGATADIVAGKDKRTRREIVEAAKAGSLADSPASERP